MNGCKHIVWMIRVLLRYGVWRSLGLTPEGFNLADGRVQQGQRG